MSCSVDPAGMTWTRMPRAASIRGVLDLIPRSSAAIVWDASPSGSTTYASRVETSSDNDAPAMDSWARTAASMVASSVRSSPEKIPAFMAPSSRMWRTTARVSIPAMPTTPWATISSSRLRVDR